MAAWNVDDDFAAFAKWLMKFSTFFHNKMCQLKAKRAIISKHFHQFMSPHWKLVSSANSKACKILQISKYQLLLSHIMFHTQFFMKISNITYVCWHFISAVTVTHPVWGCHYLAIDCLQSKLLPFWVRPKSSISIPYQGLVIRSF